MADDNADETQAALIAIAADLEESEGMRELANELTRVQLSVDSASSTRQPQPKGDRPQSHYPASYRTQTAKELETLRFAQNFDLQFRTLYKQRRRLALIFPNECGVEKFVCTSIRPSLLPYKELNHFEGAASFLADYLSYAPLAQPTELPEMLPSPSTVLWQQRANCFEFSVLLCSLLEGAGYDAYCVSGYATREICMNSRIRRARQVDTMEDKVEAPQAEAKPKKYALKPGHRLESHFLKSEAEKAKRKQEEARAKAERAASAPRPQAQVNTEEDEMYGLRVHTWILILPTRRGVPEPFFIEPTTGKALSTLDPNYLGIESVWNSKNYWVNMQSCVDGLKDIEYDLQDSSRWEFMFPEPTKDDVTINIAPSWVEKLSLEPRDYQTRCPHGHRTVQMESSIVDIYAEYLREDGLVKQVTAYEDNELKQKVNTTYIYKHRKDGLLRRLDTHHADEPDQRDCTYLPGHKYKIRRYTYTLSGQPVQRFLFYDDVRVDGLMERFDDGKELTETFAGREDRLMTCQATYTGSAKSRRRSSMLRGPPAKGSVIEMISERYARNPDVPEDEDIEEIIYFADAIQIKYHRSPHRLTASTVELEKPQATEKSSAPPITSDYVDMYRAAGEKKPLRNFELYELLQKALKMEKRCRAALENSMQETRDILARMAQDDIAVGLEISFYDTMRNEESRRRREQQELQAAIEAERLERQAQDYLAPFLAQLPNPDSPTAEDAAWLKENCLKDLKERLVERAQLIQRWFEREQRQLQDKQAWFQNNQSLITPEQEEEYVSFCSEAIFRINVLQKRLNKHKQSAPQMYAELDQRLQNDPRLAKLLA